MMFEEKLSGKDRRNSGRKEPRCLLNDTRRNIINQCLEPQTYWDDWKDHRDGLRGYGDPTKINRKPEALLDEEEARRNNKKNNKLLERRKLMKTKRPR